MSQVKKEGCAVAQQERSKRKLDFGAHRFKGKTFYLDLPRYSKVEELKEELLQRGATIEEFFHRDVKYLVTHRTKSREEGGRSDPSTLSPATPGTTKSSVQASPFSWMDSPGSVDSASLKTKPPIYETRAQKMMRMAQEKQKCAGGKVDIVTSAQQWGCKVVPLEALLKELKRLKPLPRKTKGMSVKARALKPPFLKVEDKTQAYRPLILEMTSWPLPLVPSTPSMGPYDSLKPSKGEKGGAPQSHGDEHQEGRPGYCEPCGMRYQNLHMHLQSVQHKAYAYDAKNFASLDRLILQGTSLAQFLMRERRRLLQEREAESVVNHRPVTRECVTYTLQGGPIPPPQTSDRMPPPQMSGSMPPPQPSHPMPPPQPSYPMPPPQPSYPMPPPQTSYPMPPSQTSYPMPPPQPSYPVPPPQQDVPVNSIASHKKAHQDHTPTSIQEATPTPCTPVQEALSLHTLSPLSAVCAPEATPTAQPISRQATPTQLSIRLTMFTFPSVPQSPPPIPPLRQTTPTLCQPVSKSTPPSLVHTTPTVPYHTPPLQWSTPTSMRSGDEVPETPEKQQQVGSHEAKGGRPPGGRSPLVDLEKVFRTVPFSQRLVGTTPPPLHGVDLLDLGGVRRRSPRLIVQKERVCPAAGPTHSSFPPPLRSPPVSLFPCTPVQVQRTNVPGP